MPFVLGYFSRLGTPQTGLTPTIRIRRVDTGVLVVTDAAMIEIGDGFYRYSFGTPQGFDGAQDYAIRMDGGSVLGSERYVVASNEAILPEQTVDGSGPSDVTLEQLWRTLLARFVGQADVTQVAGEKVVTYLQQDEATTQHQTTTNTSETQRRTTVDPV